MKRLVLLALPLFASTPALAADLDRSGYSEREVEIERQVPPRVVEDDDDYRPMYAERIYEAPRYYTYYDRPFFGYSYWRPRHHHWRHDGRFHWRHAGRHHHHRRW